MTAGSLDFETAAEYSYEKNSSPRTRARVSDPVGGYTIPLPNDGFLALSADDLRFVKLREDQSGHQLASVLALPDMHPFNVFCEENATSFATM